MALPGPVLLAFVIFICIGAVQSETYVTCVGKRRLSVMLRCNSPPEEVFFKVSAVKFSKILPGYKPNNYCANARKNATVLPSDQQCVIDETFLKKAMAQKCGGRGMCFFYYRVPSIRGNRTCLALQNEQAVLQTDWECKAPASVIINTPNDLQDAFTGTYYGCKLTFEPDEGISTSRGIYKIKPDTLFSYRQAPSGTNELSCDYKLRLTYQDKNEQWVTSEICANQRRWLKQWDNLPWNSVNQPLFVELYRNADLIFCDANLLSCDANNNVIKTVSTGGFNFTVKATVNKYKGLTGKMVAECSETPLQNPALDPSTTTAPSTVPSMFLH